MQNAFGGEGGYVCLVDEGDDDLAALGVAGEFLAIPPVLVLCPHEHLGCAHKSKQECLGGGTTDEEEFGNQQTNKRGG